MTQNQTILAGLLAFSLASPLAAEVNIPNTFQSGQTAKASEVNANFEALKSALVQAIGQIKTLETKIESLEQETSNLRDLNDYLTVQADANLPNEMRAVFSGINVQLTNGAGEFGGTNGLGNLIVGYGGHRDAGDKVCSRLAPPAVDQTDCESRGGIWALNHKTGSHNVLIGRKHSYSSNGALLVGTNNANSRGDVVTGVQNDVIPGQAVVLGGYNNSNIGGGVIIGGADNEKNAGPYSVIAGGRFNTVQYTGGNDGGSIFGAWNSSVAQQGATVTGGRYNSATGRFSHVSGGRVNTAAADYSSILGGEQETTSTAAETIPALP